MYKVPYIQSVGKEYQVVKRGRDVVKYYLKRCIKFLIFSLLGKNVKLWRGEGNTIAVGKNITWKKRGSNIIFPFIIRLLGRISSGEEGKGTEILGIKKLNLKKGGMERISSCRELYPLLYLNIGEDNFIPVLITNILQLEPFDLKYTF